MSRRAGIVLTALAVVLLGALLETGEALPWGWITMGALLGPTMWLSSLLQAARQRRCDAEIERARAEWDSLGRDLAQARSKGHDLAMVLRERGYREPFVRRWILHELGSGKG